MNTYKYEFSYFPIQEIEDRETRLKADRLRKSERYLERIRLDITHVGDFLPTESCEYDQENNHIIIIKSEKPKSVFDDIMQEVCLGKYITFRSI